MPAGKAQARSFFQQWNERPRTVEQKFQPEHQRQPTQRHYGHFNGIPAVPFYEKKINDQYKIGRYQKIVRTKVSNELHEDRHPVADKLLEVFEHCKIKSFFLK